MTDNRRRAAARRAASWTLPAKPLAWLQIFGSAAVPVLAGFALFAGWSWWYAGCALIAFGMGKWLAHGVEHHRQRSIFNAEIMLKGMASREFSTEWVEAYTGGN